MTDGKKKSVAKKERFTEQDNVDFQVNLLADRLRDEGSPMPINIRRVVHLFYQRGYDHGKAVQKNEVRLLKNRLRACRVNRRYISEPQFWEIMRGN